ncbi:MULTISPECIES: phosphate ABC transporter permease PstA [Vibrio]|jgi:phosphate transport system permease protein|uniref:Phosphate transport system permease protein PstA n=1 Tax=Vibrio natriegens NBRC 15636 = ATCC 14048 = DSM 759 TaxID=1219067 RepID=A0AAN0Y6D3_VIBNA|nr:MULTISPECIES: phosphate ABC transporter permease PstA [Vibrio]EHR6736219.1 phosphate ABC transporter permease PstA [Vibrio parahaemolyticus]MEE3877411.1 phosphate ABC transporter permease PstA [Vibrio sp. YYF0003]CAH0525836.1 Phosphate transport system permease protein PstA 1 [Catenococcus thiocycli]AEX25074.1 phosphate ABC transporter, permease protein [Vibrio sp. EJY3]ALR17345.1 phosphate ABC transporter permease [Vibrio natriegens NBRC 15636 = ATCC 14048 = DSM 759]
MDRAKLKQARQFKDNVFNAFVWISAGLTVGFLFWIIWYILSNGLQHVDWKFITDNYTRTGDEHGIFPMIVSTIYMVIASIAVAAPLGIMTAIYLTEYAKVGSRLVKVIRFCTESLAGIPSIIFGLFGMTFFVAILGLGFSILSGALTLSILILPVIIRTTEEALMAVPQTYREGSYGLGASKIYTIWRLILPSAMPGILTSVILSIGRVIGESAPVFLTAGMVARIPDSLLDSGRTLTVHLYKLTTELFTVEEWNQAYGTATVLIVVVLLINMVTKLIARRFNTATY